MCSTCQILCAEDPSELCKRCRFESRVLAGALIIAFAFVTAMVALAFKGSP